MLLFVFGAAEFEVCEIPQHLSARPTRRRNVGTECRSGAMFHMQLGHSESSLTLLWHGGFAANDRSSGAAGHAVGEA
jgi:hypothetical protein